MFFPGSQVDGELVLIALINGLIVGLIVMYVGRAVAGEAPWYVDAYKGSFVGSIAIAFIQLLLSLVLPADALWLTLGVSVLVGFPIYAVIFQMVIGYTLKQAAPVAGVAVVCSSIMSYGIGYFYPF